MNLVEYQKEVVQIINNSFSLNKLAHAYIFEGEKGSGLKEVAVYFAKKLLCLDNNSVCDKCENCLRVNSGTHTNVILVSPMGDTIRKDQIASIIHEGQMSSVTDKNRIFIIEEAEKLNIASANTLLKFLEEPLPNNYVILLTSNKNMLLDTIVSRSQVLRFKPVNKKELASRIQNSEITTDKAYILSELFGNEEDIEKAIKEGTIFNSFDLFKKMAFAKLSKKDIYLEYYLNKKMISEKESILWLLQIYTLFKKEEMKYADGINPTYFVDILKNENYVKQDVLVVTKQIELINEAIENINARVNTDIVIASLCQNL